jgi:hypothetical protein
MHTDPNALETGLSLLFLLPLVALALLFAIFVALLFIDHRLSRIQRSAATIAQNSAVAAGGGRCRIPARRGRRLAGESAGRRRPRGPRADRRSAGRASRGRESSRPSRAGNAPIGLAPRAARRSRRQAHCSPLAARAASSVALRRARNSCSSPASSACCAHAAPVREDLVELHGALQRMAIHEVDDHGGEEASMPPFVLNRRLEHDLDLR